MQGEESYFKFDTYTIDLPHGKAGFHYELGIPGKTLHFQETLQFTPPSQNRKIDPDLIAVLGKNLFFMLGISYWKTYCPKHIMSSVPLTEAQANFWNTVYTKGLGEFFYTNEIDYRGLIQFPFSANLTYHMPSDPRTNRSLVLLGGGKDSIVSAELLKKSDKAFAVFTLNSYPMNRPIIEKIGKEHHLITRTIDPKLFKLNGEGVYNGHVPISAVYAFTSLFAAYLYDYAYVIASNEESANYGNVEYLESEINHQWSKSEEFEQLFQTYVKQNITEDIRYFSLLRPLKEIKIVELFSHYPKYFNIFSSCNRNFSHTHTDKNAFWCGECSKCAFVFLLLSAFLPKEQVVAIFHKDLFADMSLFPIYKQLLGLEGTKPFDCVGTPEESIYAFTLMAKRGEYTDDVIVKELLPRISNKVTTEAEVMNNISLTGIPDEFRSIFSI